MVLQAIAGNSPNRGNRSHGRRLTKVLAIVFSGTSGSSGAAGAVSSLKAWKIVSSLGYSDSGAGSARPIALLVSQQGSVVSGRLLS